MFHKFKTDSGMFRFVLKAKNWETILVSESYTSDAACEAWIASVMNNADQESRYEKLRSDNHHHYFNLLSTNWKVIWTSEMYTTSAARDKWIDSVMRTAPTASVAEWVE